MDVRSITGNLSLQGETGLTLNGNNCTIALNSFGTTSDIDLISDRDINLTSVHDIILDAGSASGSSILIKRNTASIELTNSN